MINARGSKRNSRNATSARDKAGRFKKGTHWRPHAVFRERTYLDSEYREKGRSAADIAKQHGVTENAILFWLAKLDIPRRTMKEVRRLKSWSLRGDMNGMAGRCGSKNPRWIDGSSPKRQRMYARSFWKELVVTVYRRDWFRCVRCYAPHAKSSRLHAHHVKPWAGNPSSRFDLSNIITVCAACHRWIHSRENARSEFLSR